MTITEKGILAEIMATAIPAVITRADIPAVEAVVTADVVPQSLHLKDGMWEKQYEHITEVRLTTESSLILLMTVENRWNLFAEPE